jgi:DNA repair protein RecO
MAASYFADLVHRLTPIEVSNGTLYRFVGRMLDFLSKQGGNINSLHWAELKLLTLLGVGPRLLSCVACSSHDLKNSRHTAFSISRGGLLCPTCQAATEGATVPVSHDALAMLRLWQKAPSPLIAKRTTCTDPQQKVIDRILGGFMVFHLESTRSRGIVMDML